jgi:ligand-binding sensor domain-containing protein
MVFNIYQDGDNTLWIATIGGLSMIKGDKITNVNKQNGLLDDKIFDVIEDSIGYMWLPTLMEFCE